MGVLEDITQMKNEGISDNEILRDLQEKGFSPREINDAFNQLQIKDAVSEENPNLVDNEYKKQEFPPTNTQKSQEISDEESYYPQDQEYYQGAPQQGEEFESNQGQRFDTDTIIEVSEQVFMEKIQKIQKHVEEISEFKTLSEARIENLLERTKKIESLMDRLQIAILEKIASYGSNLESIKKEMSMMQDSFGKMIPKYERKEQEIEDYEEEQEIPKAKKTSKTSKKKSQKDETFSDLKKISKKK